MTKTIASISAALCALASLAAEPDHDTLIAHRGGSDAPEYIKAVKDAGFEYHVWTCNSIDQVETAFAHGVQTVTTDVPQKMLDEYNEKKR